MATLVLKDAVVTINAVNLSAWTRSVTLNYKADGVEDTNMGDTTHQRIAGLLDWDLTVEFAQDFAASAVDVTLFSLVGAAPFTVKVKATSAANSTTNPEYQGTAILTDYSPIDAGIGDLATTSVSFVAAGNLTRVTV